MDGQGGHMSQLAPRQSCAKACHFTVIITASRSLSKVSHHEPVLAWSLWITDIGSYRHFKGDFLLPVPKASDVSNEANHETILKLIERLFLLQGLGQNGGAIGLQVKLVLDRVRTEASVLLPLVLP